MPTEETDEFPWRYAVFERGSAEPWALLFVRDDEEGTPLWATRGQPEWRVDQDAMRWVFEPLREGETAFEVSAEKFETWRQKLGIRPLPATTAPATGSVVRDMALPDGRQGYVRGGLRLAGR